MNHQKQLELIRGLQATLALLAESIETATVAKDCDPRDIECQAENLQDRPRWKGPKY